MSKTSSTKDHLETTREAGIGRVSIISVLAGLVSAYGAFAVVAAVVGAILAASKVKTEFVTNDWTGSGAVALLASAVTLLIAYLFGGYVAGRMARRAGILHGILVFVATLVIGAIVGGLVALLTDDASIKSNLRSIGVPTSTSQIKGVAIVGVAVSLAAILVGAVLGGMLGERWHTKLARRAADPEIGPAAEARQRADDEDQNRRQRLDRDPLVQRDAPEHRNSDDDRPAPRRSKDTPPVPAVDLSDESRSDGDGEGAVQLDADGNEPERLYTADQWRARTESDR